MTKLEQHRKTWQGESDEWLFERLANELTQKVEEIHKLLAENEQLRLYNVSQQRELFNGFYGYLDGISYDEYETKNEREHVEDYLKTIT